MAVATVHRHQERGNNAARADTDGWHASETLSVNFTSPGLFSVEERLLIAVQMVTGQVGGIGTPHSHFPATYVNSIQPTLNANHVGLVDVEVSWEPVTAGEQSQPGDTTENVQIDVTTSLTPVTTMRDINGQQIIVQHTVGEDTEPSDIAATVEYMEPVTVIRYNRWQYNNPNADALVYVGTVNSVSVFGDPVHTWLVSRIDGTYRPFNNTPAWQASYEFIRRKRDVSGAPGVPAGQLPLTLDDWNPIVAAINPSTGNPYLDLVPGVGYKKFRIYGEADFTQMNLTFS